MNELSLFEQSKKTMTLPEVADVLGYGAEYLRKKCAELGFTQNGKKTVLTEMQVSKLKSALVPRTSEVKSKAENATTDYEMELLTQKVIMYHVQKAAEYKQRAEVAESALMRIEHAPGCFSLSQTAKALKLPYGRNTLNDKLKEMKIFMQSGEPYQEYISAGHFKVVTKHTPIGLKTVSLATGKGLVYLAKKLAAEIDESILPDEA